MGESVAVTSLPEPKQERSKQTREKIIQAAITLIQEHGYEKTSSNDIASEAGVSVGSFYTYFVDKRQLLLVIFDRLADEFSRNIFETIEPQHLFGKDVRANIRHSIATALDDQGKYLGLQRAIHELVVKDSEFAERRRAIMQRSISRLRNLISQAIKADFMRDVDPNDAAFIVHRVVFNLSVDYITGFCDFEKERAIDALTDMIYNYLFKPNPSQS